MDTKLTKQVKNYTNVPTVVTVIVFSYYYMKQTFDEMMKMSYIVTEDAVLVLQLPRVYFNIHHKKIIKLVLISNGFTWIHQNQAH